MLLCGLDVPAESDPRLVANRITERLPVQPSAQRETQRSQEAAPKFFESRVARDFRPKLEPAGFAFVLSESESSLVKFKFQPTSVDFLVEHLTVILHKAALTGLGGFC